MEWMLGKQCHDHPHHLDKRMNFVPTQGERLVWGKPHDMGAFLFRQT